MLKCNVVQRVESQLQHAAQSQPGAPHQRPPPFTSHHTQTPPLAAAYAHPNRAASASSRRGSPDAPRPPMVAPLSGPGAGAGAGAAAAPSVVPSVAASLVTASPVTAPSTVVPSGRMLSGKLPSPARPGAAALPPVGKAGAGAAGAEVVRGAEAGEGARRLGALGVVVEGVVFLMHWWPVWCWL